MSSEGSAPGHPGGAPPGNGTGQALYALCVLLPMARMDEALAMVREATRIDPLSLFVSSTKTAILLMLRRIPEADRCMSPAVGGARICSRLFSGGSTAAS